MPTNVYSPTCSQMHSYPNMHIIHMHRHTYSHAHTHIHTTDHPNTYTHLTSTKLYLQRPCSSLCLPTIPASFFHLCSSRFTGLFNSHYPLKVVSPAFPTSLPLLQQVPPQWPHYHLHITASLRYQYPWNPHCADKAYPKYINSREYIDQGKLLPEHLHLAWSGMALSSGVVIIPEYSYHAHSCRKCQITDIAKRIELA